MSGFGFFIMTSRFDIAAIIYIETNVLRRKLKAKQIAKYIVINNKEKRIYESNSQRFNEDFSEQT